MIELFAIILCYVYLYYVKLNTLTGVLILINHTHFTNTLHRRVIGRIYSIIYSFIYSIILFSHQSQQVELGGYHTVGKNDGIICK